MSKNGDSSQPSQSVGNCLFYPVLPCEADRLATLFEVPEALGERCHSTCCSVVEKRILRGRTLKTAASASVYAVCREYNIPVTIRELAKVTGAEETAIAKGYKSMLLSMGITPHVQDGLTHTLKLASRLSSSKAANVLALGIVEKALDAGVEGSPMTIAAGALYNACLATGECLRQYQVADAAGVTEASVRRTSRAMRPFSPEPKSLA